MKILIELAPVVSLLDVIRRHLLADTPMDGQYEQIVKEETATFLNILLDCQTVAYDEEYLQECDYLYEALDVVSELEHCRAWKPFAQADIQSIEVRNGEGLVMITLIGALKTHEHLRLFKVRQYDLV